MHKFLSKIITVILIILICYSLSICSFATGEPNNINIDGNVTSIEWPHSSKVKFKNYDFNNDVNYATVNIKFDYNAESIYFGFKVSENGVCSNTSSAVQIQLNNKTISIIRGNVCNNDGLTINYKLAEASIYSYNIEAKILYPHIDEHTQISVCFIDAQNKTSPRFYINTHKMSAHTYSELSEHTTTAEHTATVEHGTIEETTTQETNKKTDQTTEYEYETTAQETKTGKKSKVKSPNMNSSNDVDFNTKTSNLTENNQLVIENKNGNIQNSYKTKRIVLTIFSCLLIIVALVLPIIKYNKNKQDDSNNKKEKN